MSKFWNQSILLALISLLWNCAGSEIQPMKDYGPQPDIRPARDRYLPIGDISPGHQCNAQGQTQCDDSETQLMTCMKDAEGTLIWGAPVPCRGAHCSAGKCIDPCEMVTCATPPNSCYKTPGTCWNGECQYDLKPTGNGCDDEEPCTVDDQCNAGICAGRPKVCDTAPKNECNGTDSLKVYTAPGFCQEGACIYGSAEVPCTFGCDTPSGTCNGDPCGSVTCNTPPSSSCYKAAGICSGGDCTYLYDDSATCTDANLCTINDKCVGGNCVGTVKQCTTPPTNVCTSGTLKTYETKGQCTVGECSYPENLITCARGCNSTNDDCEGDACEGVVCITPPNTCYKVEGTCAGGSCTYDYDDDKICDDQNSCTDDDHCSSGVCGGNAKICNTPPPTTCVDATNKKVYTTPGLCAVGDCVYASAQVPCTYGCDAATGKCNGDPCATVTCNTPPNACYSSPGQCSNGECSYIAAVGKICNDNNLCTYEDKCTSTGTCAGIEYQCDADRFCNSVSSSLPCTNTADCVVGTCDGKNGCSYETAENSCLLMIENCPGGPCAMDYVCFQGGALNPKNSCQFCDPEQSSDYWSVATGTPSSAWNFDDGTLMGFVVTPTPATSLAIWQVDNGRAAEGTHSLYFGHSPPNADLSQRYYGDGLNIVSGEVTSPQVTLPTGQGKLCVKFSLFKDTENAREKYDQLYLRVLPPSPAAAVQVWQSGKDSYVAETFGEFLTFSADITAFAGSTIKFQFAFDSYDGYQNLFEGVYLDAIKVISNCTP